jgi:hypothetical protein
MPDPQRVGDPGGFGRVRHEPGQEGFDLLEERRTVDHFIDHFVVVRYAAGHHANHPASIAAA